MGKKYLIDTNVLIDAQMSRLPKESLSFLTNVIDQNFTVSFITRIEFLGYKDITKSSEDFISLASVIGIDDSIVDTCIHLRRTRKIKIPDAIIAATSLTHNLTLITRNTSDFYNILNLKLIDPYNL